MTFRHPIPPPSLNIYFSEGAVTVEPSSNKESKRLDPHLEVNEGYIDYVNPTLFKFTKRTNKKGRKSCLLWSFFYKTLFCCQGMRHGGRIYVWFP